MHYTGGFAHDWVTHLGPIYLAVIVFIVGVVLAYNGLESTARDGPPNQIFMMDRRKLRRPSLQPLLKE
mgnify:CR=1 FL=1